MIRVLEILTQPNFKLLHHRILTKRKSTPGIGNEVKTDAPDTGMKNSNSCDSAPEVHSEDTQMEPKPGVGDQVNTVDHGTIAPPSQITSENPIQDRPKSQVTTEEPEPDASQETCLEPEKPKTISLNPENIPEASKTGESYSQDKEVTLDTAHTEATLAQQGAAMSAPVEPNSTDTAKKVRAQQMQSLHPFATKNKAQAKKEKETKKKQQKKEEADRIAKAKAKANKIASLKKVKILTDPQRELETSMGSANSSIAGGVRFDVDAAGERTEDTPDEIKKSNGPTKAKATDFNTEDNQKKMNQADESAQHPGLQQASSTEPERQLDSESLLSPQELGSTSISKKAIPLNAPSHDEANPSHNDSTPTHEPECETGSEKKPSTSLLAIPTPSAEESELGHGASNLPQDTPVLETAAQSENASAETPKKKKRKNKKKNKKKTPASELSTDDQSATNERTQRPVVPCDWDMHSYDPFTSQMTHIEAIRYAVKHDTKSYFAKTNARMDTKRKAREATEKLLNSLHTLIRSPKVILSTLSGGAMELVRMKAWSIGTGTEHGLLETPNMSTESHGEWGFDRVLLDVSKVTLILCYVVSSEIEMDTRQRWCEDE
ncbi:hypothetical protein COCMIDRAFT_103308 [Bipolaris oryzae ATCC 44560]|uniref:Uncharacterized protein n=1 Tax=Bipolaris oryzae ATCC 44560 TaxID=930090 RepID=W6Z4G6_COCMI|nr:uncharacterized protein COCMIDRAFT_103308 [Bipolaris oryzae ATCC 44560]EUC42504.1 hypothetical protein COCMIDRAFT_103308 [Bipolaris oryzae ATCC 44560]